MDKLVEVRNLKQYYPIKGKSRDGQKRVVKAIDGVSFDIYQGETLGLVGESGCGKTTIGRSILRLVEPSAGEVLFRGQDLLRLKAGDLRPLRREMQMVFQDPYGSLDPHRTVEDLIARPLRLYRYGTKQEIAARVRELLEIVGIDRDYTNRYPHEFSGGQRQRIGFARAVALTPQFIVCDEPVSALDVSIQAQVINLMGELQRQVKLTYLFISHDLRVVHHISDRVVVMYLGRIVERASRDELYRNPCHPYTRSLLSAIPEVDRAEGLQTRQRLQGDIPSPLDIPQGCRFHTRCPEVKPICHTEDPPETQVQDGHFCCCHLAHGC
jgi:oligopeptide/dipeptide ABC transporter ATP-binding protein